MSGPMSTNGEALPLHPDQVETAAGMLARAFHDDPLARFIFPDLQRRRHHLPVLFGEWVRDGLRHGKVVTLGADVAVAIWMPPHAAPPPQPGTAEVAAAAGSEAAVALTADERERLERFGGHVEALHARLMPEPHAALLAVGVDPAHQGQGLGSALIAPTLAKYADETVPCYLDTGTARNVRFYEWHGFRVLEEGVVPRSSFRVWAMRRG
jgi:GNAT superfamily N-acetyltransferase